MKYASVMPAIGLLAAIARSEKYGQRCSIAQSNPCSRAQGARSTGVLVSPGRRQV